MNLPAAFEGAVAAALKVSDEAQGIDLPRIRCWHIIDGDARWTATSDRVFPLVDIRCNLPTTGADGCTQVATVRVLCATWADDDQTHATLDNYTSIVETVLSALYAQFRSGTAGDERTRFDAYISGVYPDVAAGISIGGFEIGESLHPHEDGGANFEGRDFIIHFSRTDY